jgi:hypothetical protein
MNTRKKRIDIVEIIGRDDQGHSQHIAEITGSSTFVLPGPDGGVRIVRQNEDGQDELVAFEDSDGVWTILKRP